MDMPRCFILIGPPGCGKSTWREKTLPTLTNPVVISSDDLVDELAAQDGKSHNQKFVELDYDKDVVPRLKMAVTKAIISGSDIIIDQTNRTVEHRRLFRHLIPASYEIVGVVFEYDPDEIRARVKARGARTVPDFIMDKHINNFVQPLPGEFETIMVVPRG